VVVKQFLDILQSKPSGVESIALGLAINGFFI
jgi:hypothetical protein